MNNIHNFLEWNPQLFREIKGRLKPQNLVIALVISLITQGLVYFYYQNLLPLSPSAYSEANPEVFNRYCIGNPPPNWEGYLHSNTYIPNDYCVEDFLGNWMLNWQLWWLDIFICLSIIGIIALLVAGTWMLIADLSREERRGTLNFIRLSPQSAKTILIGKMLGVPIVLYLAVGLAVPLHLMAGLSARIPLDLILTFYGVVAVSCVFFYSAALLFGLVSTGLGGFQAWLGSGVVLFFLWTIAVVTGHLASLNWLTLFYPGSMLPYLVRASFLPPETMGYLSLEGLASWQWYGQSLWRNAWSGIGFSVLHYGLWIYWIGQGMVRRFRNPSATLWSKGQSYLISASFIAVIVGFIPQTTDTNGLFYNLGWLQIFVLLFLWMLIAVLSPHRQTLQDWARYRHQMSRDRRNFLKDLIWGEKSPSTIAIALNLAIIWAFTLPFVLLYPLGNYRMPVLLGLLLEGGIILVYAAIAQLILLMKTPKRAIAAATVVGALAILPLVYLAVTSTAPDELTWVWLLSCLPGVATEFATTTMVCLSMLGQWLVITLTGFQMTRQLQKAGESGTKALLAQGNY